MRGGGGVPLRRGQKMRPMNEATADVETLPAPIGGWNTTSALASMPAIDCVICDNFWPDTAAISLRAGSEDHATGITGDVETVMTYSSGAVTSLWAAVSSGIYNCTNPGGIGALGIAATNARFSYTNFSNTGGGYLIAVNGVDKLKLYDGTAWANIDGVSVPAITGVATTELIHIVPFKSRLWFLRKNSMNAYYLGLDAIAGALTVFPMGGIFKLGGHLVAQGSWTIDGGSGSDDYFVTITSEGEAAVYQGTDPASASTWALVGVYFVGRPLGTRCLTKYGGDLVYVSQTGIMQFSKILSSPVTGNDIALSYKIQKVISQSAELYGSNFGWQPLMFPTQNALIVNVPITTNTTQYQYCMNTITKAWTRFLGWNANCFELFGKELYFGTAGKVCKAWVGLSDSGVAINGEVQQAYTTFARKGQKQVSLTRPNLAISGSVALQLRYDTDFNTDVTFSQVNLGISGSSLWDTAVWDSSTWGGDLAQLRGLWLTVNNNPGYFQSFRLRVQTATATFTWTSTDFAFRQGGIL